MGESATSLAPPWNVPRLRDTGAEWRNVPLGSVSQIIRCCSRLLALCVYTWAAASVTGSLVNSAWASGFLFALTNCIRRSAFKKEGPSWNPDDFRTNARATERRGEKEKGWGKEKRARTRFKNKPIYSPISPSLFEVGRGRKSTNTTRETPREFRMSLI